MKKKIAIICPIGKTGNVVTMTLNYYLRAEEGLNIKEAFLTKNAGKRVWLSKDNQGKTIVTPDKSDDLELVVIVPHTQVAVYPGNKKKKMASIGLAIESSRQIAKGKEIEGNFRTSGAMEIGIMKKVN